MIRGDLDQDARAGQGLAGAPDQRLVEADEVADIAHARRPEAILIEQRQRQVGDAPILGAELRDMRRQMH